MAGTVKHNDLTPLFGLTEWIAEHNFAGGATGALLHRDSGQTDGANWLAAVATGSVLISSGVGAAPAWSATPSLTSLTLGTTGNISLTTSGAWVLGGTPGGAGSSSRYISGGGSADSWFFNVPTGGTHYFAINDAQMAKITSVGITVGSTTLLTTSVALTNGAAAQTGTLTNAPAAGNPSKWIPINDNGTVRYIPAW
jgi:hypothetical protein